jgi:glycosyltransferase involved in cell wall biosynthesis
VRTGAGVFLTWNDSRRSRSLAERYGLELVKFVVRRSGASRHLIGAVVTLDFLLRSRPTVICYQFSLALAVVLATYARIRPSSVVLIADVHTKALRRDGGRVARWLVYSLKGWALRTAATVLVTNEENAMFANLRFRVEPVILPDPIPRPPEPSSDPRASTVEGPPCVVFICSFADDEPIDLIRRTAHHLGGTAEVKVTGDPSKLGAAERTLLEPILTGFLPESEYWELLRRAAAVVVLTTEAACLPCGAYEALAVRKRPVLLRDRFAREVFGDLAIFASPDPEALAAAVGHAVVAGPLSANALERYEARWATSARRAIPGERVGRP